MVAVAGVASKSDGTLTGSLLQLARSFAGSRGACSDDAVISMKLAASVEHVSGQWPEPASGCPRLDASNHILAQAVVVEKSFVQSVIALGDGEHIVSGSWDGVVRVQNYRYLDTQLELPSHNHAVTCLSVAAAEW